LGYTQDHLWISEHEDHFTIGWTDYAQYSAGDISFVELMEADGLLASGQEFGSIETAKWVGKLYLPCTCRVLKINQKVLKDATLINSAPYTAGWLIKVLPESHQGTPYLSAAEYLDFLKSDCLL
jgi:glycine cleavage system H protein